MEGIQNLSYQNDNGEKTFFNNDANLSPEIRNFLSDKKLDKTELQALHYILYNNENKEILNSTDNLSDLSNLLKYIPVHSDKYKVRNRVNQILGLTSNNIDKTNKIQNYNTLKKEARILGKEKISIFQKIIGAGEDGKFGPNTFRKYRKYNSKWKNESITDFLNRKSGVKKEEQEKKGFWEDFFDGPDFLKNNKNKETELKKIENNDYSSILKLDYIKKAIKKGELRVGKYKVTLSKLENYKIKGIRKIKMKYSGVRYDLINVNEAIKLYKDMINSGEISIKINKYGVDKSKNNLFNDSATRGEAEKEYNKLDDKEKKSLKSLFLYARKFKDFKISNKFQRKVLNKIVGFNVLEQPWCGGFLRGISKHEGFTLNNVKNTNVAGSYFGIEKTGLHIGMSDGMGNMISGNRGGKVTYEKLNNYICWILPQDAGNLNKVHYKYEGQNPPAGAYIIPYARKSSMKKYAQEIATGKRKIT